MNITKFLKELLFYRTPQMAAFVFIPQPCYDVWCIKNGTPLFINWSGFLSNSVKVYPIKLKTGMLYHMNNAFRNTVFRHLLMGLKLWAHVPVAVKSCPAAAHVYRWALWTILPFLVSSSGKYTMVKTKKKE